MNTQIKEGDLVVFRLPTDCQKVASATFYEDGEIESVRVTDGIETTLLKWRDREDDPVIELSVSFGKILAEVLELHKELQWGYECVRINLAIEQETNPFGKARWVSDLPLRRDDEAWDEEWGYVLDWEMSEDEIRNLAKEMFDNAVSQFKPI